MPTPQQLHDAARTLANTYNTLQELADTPPRTPNVRKMKPTFGPQPPTIDHDFTLNITHELMRETKDPNIPGGLATMAHDALQYTKAPQHTPHNTGWLDDNIAPAILCAHIARQSQPISQTFPAATELLELLQAQHQYLTKQINNRYGRPEHRQEARQTSTTIKKILAQQGITITRQHLHTWAKRGHITQHPNNQGKPTYLISEVIQWASRHDATKQHPNT